MAMKNKKKSNLLMNIVLVIALGVFAFSGFKIYQIYGNYKAIDEEYETIKQEFVAEEVIVEKETDAEGVEEEVTKVAFKVDFDSLLAINEDVIGWIHFDEPATISYPIMQAADNDYYLKHSLEKKYLSAGSIFMDYQNDSDFKDENTVIYGHNMKNGSMFGQLKKFKNKEFCKSNPYFYINTVDGREITYQIFAVKLVGDTSSTYDKFYADKDEFQQYLNDIYKNAVYTSSDVSVSTDDRIVTLSTCTGDDSTRLVVFGVVIGE